MWIWVIGKTNSMLRKYLFRIGSNLNTCSDITSISISLRSMCFIIMQCVILALAHRTKCENIFNVNFNIGRWLVLIEGLDFVAVVNAGHLCCCAIAVLIRINNLNVFLRRGGCCCCCCGFGCRWWRRCRSCRWRRGHCYCHYRLEDRWKCTIEALIIMCSTQWYEQSTKYHCKIDWRDAIELY